MKVKEKIIYCINSSKKYYKQFLIFITLLSILIVGVFTFKKALLNYLYYGIMNNYNYNYAFVTYSVEDRKEDVINKLKNIKNIKEVFNDYENEVSVYIDKIGNMEFNGSFFLIGKSTNDLKKVSSNYNNKNDIICPKSFYHSDNIEEKKFLKRKDFYSFSIGDTIDSHYFKTLDDDGNSSKVKLKMKVVDIFDNSKYTIDENTCYASRELLSEIFNNSYPENYFSNQIDSLMISINNSNNHDYVKEEVEKLGYEFSDVYFIDYSFINFVKKISAVLMISSILFVFLLIVNMNKKRFYDKLSEFNILRTIGYSKNEVKSILMYDSSIILLFSILVSSFVIVILIFIIKLIIYNYPLIISKLELSFDFKTLFLFYLVYAVFFVVNSQLYYNKLIKAQDEVL
ncbi:MAG: hypothetical protein IJ399_00440 [Bacilli bacterium]|nr:hypothetical protein [Bacilli bacterium]